MEHLSAGSASRQEHQHHQQFCLRWHNHQTSLLSSLPILLDQSHLTDVTLSAEGRTLRAHRVVLSACSTFFLELFRALDSSNHPVIIIPGASFAAIVALLTFMYSGEVNVFEEQIPTLLNLAETLGIKGLADVQSNMNNANAAKKRQDFMPQAPQSVQPQIPPQALKDEEIPSPTLPSLPPPSSPLIPNKIPTPLENFFLKSLQFYPNLIPQPLNFSQSALNKTSEFLAKYQQQCGMYRSAVKETDNFNPSGHQSVNDDSGYNKRTNSGEKKTKDVKRIDKIVENLRCASQSLKIPDTTAAQVARSYPDIVARSPSSPLAQAAPSFPTTKSMTNFSAALGTSNISNSPMATSSSSSVKDEQEKSSLASSSSEQGGNSTPNSSTTPNSLCPPASAGGGGGGTQPEGMIDKPASSPQSKISNSKLYATCFICHKQLSNQYNLRVHLETHQNVRYACNVCSHVSRSKDALRKHVSYRHPGAPSPCETEARRKRAKGLSSAYPLATPSEQEQMAAQLNPSAFMFMPNQFHLPSASNVQIAAAAASLPTSATSSTANDSPMIKRESTPTSPSNDHQQNSSNASFPTDSAAKP
ncbi:broad-complex core protein isoforms 1/2/3/4/5 [Eupeodes corollae]|uniref:broad-complex core protein isoforms 1/2/3/4/5 n=1 Tax=Eupeodes corollae TaxID=290404 RepID=UPI0024906D1D|nr:broad-complex core protein isoforms 1/2/3/4/5 [Eupeodes corollae]